MTKIIIIGILFFSNVYAQEYGTGLLLDSALYAENSPIAAPLMRGDYENLPVSSSLKALIIVSCIVIKN